MTFPGHRGPHDAWPLAVLEVTAAWLGAGAAVIEQAAHLPAMDNPAAFGCAGRRHDSPYVPGLNCHSRYRSE